MTTIGHAYTVVVGVSSTSGSTAALRWAFDEAAQHGGQLLAVRAWRPPAPPAAVAGRPSVVSIDPEHLFEAAQDQLVEEVTTALGPDAAGVTCELVHGGRRQVLLRASVDADLLVIDAPRRTDLRTSPLFARRLVYRASCPVVIMPPSLTRQSDTAG